jgi:hypothetical protein
MGRIMRNIFVMVLIALSSSAFAQLCEQQREYVTSDVRVYRDEDKESHMYHVRVPPKYEGKELRFLVLTVGSNGSNALGELSVPMIIRKKGEVAGSYFYSSMERFYGFVTASYGDDMCLQLKSKKRI